MTNRLLAIVDHALVRCQLAIVRDKRTTPYDFRLAIRRLAGLIAAEATRDLATSDVTVETPLAPCPGHIMAERIGLVPILRAGLGMIEPVLELIPDAEVWHLGLYRDERTAKPIHYYSKLKPDAPVHVAFILDPMLATGGSAALACKTLRDWGANRIKLLSVIAAPEGIARVHDEFPDVEIVTCAVDRGLNEQKFIVPGLGDAGDRMFNTPG
jgi:uracil phosphoribosyltransferase